MARRYPGLDLRRVRRIEQVDQAELARLYRQADLFLFPSTCEGFGLPVLEAMASGAPVVTSTASSLPEVAGQAALLVDPHDVGRAGGSYGAGVGRSGAARPAAGGRPGPRGRVHLASAAEQTLAVYRQAMAV